MTTVDGQPGDSSGRALALQRGKTAQTLLRSAARLARDESLPVSSLPAILRPRGTIADGAGGMFSLVIRLSFLLLVVAPSVLLTLYYGFIATGQYVAEMKFAVRSGDKSALEVSPLGASNPINQVQDTLVVRDYVISQPMVEALDKELNLRARFSSDKADFVSALSSSASIEDLTRYWRDHVRTSIETTSGLVTIRVYGFTPDDSLQIAQAITRRSEDLVNEMSERTSADLLRDTESEVARAEEQLKATRAALQTLRNESNTLDPDEQATGLGEVLVQLRVEREAAAERLAVASQGLSPDAPQLRPLRARLAALDAQIAQIEAEMTASASVIKDFSQAELEAQIAEKRYITAVQALEAARVAADRRRVYINTFVQPTMPQEATYPHRLWFIGGGVMGLLVLWAALASIAGIVRQRMR